MNPLARTTERQHPLLQLTLMRWRIFAREPAAVFWTYGFPIALALALGVAFRNRPPDPIDVAIESSPQTEAWRSALSKDPSMQVHWLSPEEAHNALRSGKVSLVVGGGDSRIYQFDPTRPDSRIARALVDDALQRAEGRLDVKTIKDKLVTEPGSRYIDFLIPGLLGFNLMSSGMWGVGFVLVEMRVGKLIKRFTATPMSRTHFLLSFVLVRALFLLGELPLLLAFAYWVFDVPIRGSLLLIAGLSTLGSLVFAGMGLLVGSRAKNTQTVAGLVNLVTLPMAICSGVFFSSGRFPEVIQPVIKMLPLTAVIESVRAVMLDGAGLAAVARQITLLLAWGAVTFILALKLFRWQ
jgi:ABC-2 type transport system permease protein